jgi:hypothetical protein
MSAAPQPADERPLPLDVVQRWMQSVITHPGGVLGGLESEAARAEIDLPATDLPKVIAPSRALTSHERLEIYAQAYYARLFECLREEFPALRHAVGDEAFDALAFGYLQEHPSASYTLGNLGREFPGWLQTTRDPADGEWPQLLIDLARLERTYSEVFDGPGCERGPQLTAADLQAMPPERWPEARLQMAPCFRLLEASYPVHEFATAVRNHTGDAEIPLPQPARTLLAITRRDYVVRRYALSETQHRLLTALARGEAIATAIAEVAETADSDDLGADLHGWFRDWTAAPFFAGLAQ